MYLHALAFAVGCPHRWDLSMLHLVDAHHVFPNSRSRLSSHHFGVTETTFRAKRVAKSLQEECAHAILTCNDPST